jgi:hypothetical protein
MTPLPLDQPVAITLEAQAWNVVLTALNEAPMPLRLTGPVMEAMVRQFNAVQPVNGEDRHHSSIS